MKKTIALFALGLGTPAAAQDVLIDATDPAVIARAMQAEGYKAELTTNKQGEPVIKSGANGDNFTVEFYGCKGVTGCTSFQFFSWYKKEANFTPTLANEWNASKRFIKAAIDKDGDLSIYMDVTGVGKMTQANFADALDWFAVMQGEVQKFLAARRTQAASGS
ncbi:YbjN domain-containing protein [Sphingomonas spermidinifaciens]|nr:YbjN domain-containing protein [Sphingomonas spermidinifaciens]